MTTHFSNLNLDKDSDDENLINWNDSSNSLEL